MVDEMTGPHRMGTRRGPASRRRGDRRRRGVPVSGPPIQLRPETPLHAETEARPQLVEVGLSVSAEPHRVRLRSHFFDVAGDYTFTVFPADGSTLDMDTQVTGGSLLPRLDSNQQPFVTAPCALSNDGTERLSSRFGL
jgi:hypothetical protein